MYAADDGDEDILRDEIEQAVEECGLDHNVTGVYIFGSYKEGTADSDSDLDLMVEVDGHVPSPIEKNQCVNNAASGAGYPTDEVDAQVSKNPCWRFTLMHQRDTVVYDTDTEEYRDLCANL